MLSVSDLLMTCVDKTCVTQGCNHNIYWGTHIPRQPRTLSKIIIKNVIHPPPISGVVVKIEVGKL